MLRPKILKYLLAPFFLFAVADDAAGGAVEDYGNEIDPPKAVAVDLDTIIDPLKDEKAAAEAAAKNEAEAAEADDKDGKKKDTRVPLARHEAILAKERAAREAAVAELAKYQKGEQIAKVNETIDATETKLIEMETEYNKLLADGEVAKATAKMTEIRKMERTIGDHKAEMKAQEAEIRAVERVRYDTVVERVETAYPQLNPDSAEFNKAVTDEVLELKSAYLIKGLTPSAALQKAVKYVIGAETAKEKTAVDVLPNADKDAVAKARKEAALKTSLAAAKASPAAMGKVGLNSDEKGGVITAEAAMAMSQDDFAKIDEKTLARMRGDEL